MHTKSKIQQILERQTIKDSFGQKLISLMNTYQIQDNVFINENGGVVDITSGYFEVASDYDNITEALRNFDIADKCFGIRIIDNKSFQLGYVRKLLSECDQEKTIMDINGTY